MSDIIQIRARIETADVDRAATDAWIYLAIAGGSSASIPAAATATSNAA
jgi:hypothetical protein